MGGAAPAVLVWRQCGWITEVWHKVLKSGCQIEARQLASRERLERCLTVYSVIAWRVLQAVLLARAAPDLPCTALLEADEWQALWCAIHRSPTPPTHPPTLQEAVRWLGRLGGHLGRKRDGEPGVTVLWKGFQHLADLTAMYRIMKPSTAKVEVGKG
jgi:Transposase Tn5 dimerisation domain